MSLMLIYVDMFQSVLSIGFVFGGSMSQLINGLSVSEWIFYGLIFLSCIIMRFTRRNYKRPFKVSDKPSMFTYKLFAMFTGVDNCSHFHGSCFDIPDTCSNNISTR